MRAERFKQLLKNGVYRSIGETSTALGLANGHEQRMLRSLHGRWPYRRSHCRHDLHWLVRVRAHRRWCGKGRAHSMAGLPACRRRPYPG